MARSSAGIAATASRSSSCRFSPKNSLSQTAFTSRIGVPVATLRNCEPGSSDFDTNAYSEITGLPVSAWADRESTVETVSPLTEEARCCVR